MMSRLIKKRSKKVGLPPGTLIHIGERKTDTTKITILDYNERQSQEREVARIESCFPFKDESTVTWINIDGIHQVEILEELGKHFGLHSLVREVNNDAESP